MASTQTASIKKVKIKVLEIYEQGIQNGNGGELPATEVALAIGPIIGSVPGEDGPVAIYQGEMTYFDSRKKKNREVDLVEAVFSADQGEQGEQGNVKLDIKLTGTNEFVVPLVTTRPTDPTSVPDHCVSVSSNCESGVTITFLEPAEGEFVAYPALYFHTTEGVIDPGISVRRSTGN